MPWAAAAAAAAAIGGGMLQADASKSAAQTQAKAATSASETQQRMFNQTQQNLSPYMQAGNLSLQQLMQGMGMGTAPVGPTAGVDYTQNLVQSSQVNPDDPTYKLGAGANADPSAPRSFMSSALQNDPYYRQVWDQVVKAQGGNSQAINPQTLEAQLKNAFAQGGQGGVGSGVAYGSLTQPFGLDQFQASPAYQFNLQQGQMAIDKAARARGMSYAPQTLQDIGKYSQGVASNEYQNAFANYRATQGDIFSRLSGLSGAGQNAAAQQGGFAQQTGAAIGANQIGAGNATAAGQVGQANAINQGVGNAYNAYLMQQILGQNQQPTYNTQQQQGGFDSSMSNYA